MFIRSRSCNTEHIDDSRLLRSADSGLHSLLELSLLVTVLGISSGQLLRRGAPFYFSLEGSRKSLDPLQSCFFFLPCGCF